MTKISVVIITFNEERNIRRCLESVKNIADEIIVLDSFSTDSTETICKEYEVKFFQHKFENYAQQKNLALNYTTYSHVLSLDADEAVSEKLEKEILEIKNNWNLKGYYLKRLTNYCGKWIQHCDWYPDKKLRLWDKTQARWEGEIHEKVVLPKADTKTLQNDLLHYSFYSINQHIDQINKFSSIKAQIMLQKGKKFSYVKMFGSSFSRFFKTYFLKSGFKDGFYGFVICLFSGFSNLLKYAKLKQLYNQQKTAK